MHVRVHLVRTTSFDNNRNFIFLCNCKHGHRTRYIHTFRVRTMRLPTSEMWSQTLREICNLFSDIDSSSNHKTFEWIERPCSNLYIDDCVVYRSDIKQLNTISMLSLHENWCSSIPSAHEANDTYSNICRIWLWWKPIVPYSIDEKNTHFGSNFVYSLF